MPVAGGARKYFTDQCFQQPASGYEKTRGGPYNPRYLYYTPGKLEILKLRDDNKTIMGTAYSLEAFNTAFVKQGGVPVKIIRKIPIPGDTASVS